MCCKERKFQRLYLECPNLFLASNKIIAVDFSKSWKYLDSWNEHWNSKLSGMNVDTSGNEIQNFLLWLTVEIQFRSVDVHLKRRIRSSKLFLNLFLPTYISVNIISNKISPTVREKIMIAIIIIIIIGNSRESWQKLTTILGGSLLLFLSFIYLLQ